MTRVLIAVDDTDASVRAARAAHRLFGDDASYLVVNVADSGVNGAMAWGYAYPVAMPMLDVPIVSTDAGADRSIVDDAEQRAADVAEAADVPVTEAMGETGDVPNAILAAAREHQVDVIVVGSHERSWFSRLLTGSVSDTVVREADIPVLVVR